MAVWGIGIATWLLLVGVFGSGALFATYVVASWRWPEAPEGPLLIACSAFGLVAGLVVSFVLARSEPSGAIVYLLLPLVLFSYLLFWVSPIGVVLGLVLWWRDRGSSGDAAEGSGSRHLVRCERCGMLMREPLSGQPRVHARCPDLTGEAPVWGE